MKKKLFCLLAALSVLTLTACGVGVIGGADGPTAIYTAVGPDAPEKATLPAAPAEPEEPPAVPEDPGTASGSEEDAPYEEAAIDEDGSYNSVEDVSLYLHTYDHLPDNYITKQEARDLGWTGGSVERYAPGCAIGGDRFGNREGLLPAKKGRSYTECDINTVGKRSRGAERIIFSSDGLVYYTGDHYESFELLYGEP